MAGKSTREHRVRIPLSLALLSLALVVLVAACGNDDDATEPAAATPTPAPADESTPTPTPQPADEATLTPTPEPEDEGPAARSASISDFQLPTMTIEVGAVVRFVNNDSAPHTATEVDGAWDSGTLNQGESWEYEFTEAGTFEYFCAIHPQMTGTITVE